MQSTETRAGENAGPGPRSGRKPGDAGRADAATTGKTRPQHRDNYSPDSPNPDASRAQ